MKRKDFLKKALALFKKQAVECEVYATYLKSLGREINAVDSFESIPFLPIQFFKSHKVVSGKLDEHTLFESSATTSQIPAKHYVTDINLYKESCLKGFEQTFGHPNSFCILALLPHYLEREHSSLVHMVKGFMDASGHALNGFYLDEREKLKNVILDLEAMKQPSLLFGVTFALLDFAEEFKNELKYVRVIETGGMKGRREELTRSEVHTHLKNAWGLPEIFSEYGMAELLSQSWSLEQGVFKAPAWKKVLVRDLYDPFSIQEFGRGALNIIDLANANSCSFIATDDLGEVSSDVSFTVEGRLDSSEIRGCNLLIE